jgi:hypothetical protein
LRAIAIFTFQSWDKAFQVVLGEWLLQERERGLLQHNFLNGVIVAKYRREMKMGTTTPLIDSLIGIGSMI